MILVAALCSTILAGCVTAQVFERVSIFQLDSDSTDSRSVALIDLDGDTRLDIFFTNSSHQHSRLFLNGLDGTWLNTGAGALTSAGGRSDGASFADADGDGDLDVAVVNWYGEPNQLFRNESGLEFSRILTGPVVAPGSYSETCSWSDVNGDGWLDLYVTNSEGSLQNGLFLNTADSALEFIQETESELVQWGGHSRAAAFGDWDLDGVSDLLVTNEGADPNHPFRFSTGTGWSLDFGNPLYASARNTMTASWGDVDNDGYPDLFLGNHGQADLLYRVTPQGGFVQDTLSAFPDGTRSFGSAFGDLDNDGDLDLFVTQGWGPSPNGYTDLLFRNDGHGVFTPWPDSLLAGETGWSYGCGLGDLDQDGHLDAVVARWFGENQPNRVWRNTLQGGNWVQLDLVGSPPNTSAIGARVVCRATIGGNPVTQSRWVEGQSGYCGQVLRQFIGLGDGSHIDELRVYWPDGTEDSWQDPPINVIHVLEQGSGQTRVGSPDQGSAPSGIELLPAYPNPFNQRTRVRWHQPEPGRTTVDLYSLTGQKVSRLLDAGLPAGSHEKVLDLPGLPSGPYLVVVGGGERREVGRLLLLK